MHTAQLLNSIECIRMKCFSGLINYITIIFFISIHLVANGSSAAELYVKSGSEVDGFRGITWGTEIKTLKDMQYVRVDQDYRGGEVLVYHRKGDSLKINSATLTAIEYRFWRDLFFNAEIIIKGHTDFMRLLKDTQKTFGQGHQPNKHVERYYWYGNKASIVLNYNTKSQAGSMCIQSGDCNLINEQLKLLENKNEQKERKVFNSNELTRISRDHFD